MASEDLMYEHALLDRIILLLEHINIKLVDDLDISKKMEQIIILITIVKDFIENFHEKMEEKYIFPYFSKHEKYKEYINILIFQHIESNKITNKIIEYAKENNKELNSMIHQFIYMYRAHANRENTIIFKKIKKIIPIDEYKKISEKMDLLEDEQFGKGAYDKFLKMIIDIENYYNLSLKHYNVYD